MQNQKIDDDPKTGQTVNQSILDSHGRVRNILALFTVVGFVIGIAILAIVFPLAKITIPEGTIEAVKDISSIYSGLVGMIVGYYFGKS
jgi:hypothetical protein